MLAVLATEVCPAIMFGYFVTICKCHMKLVNAEFTALFDEAKSGTRHSGSVSRKEVRERLKRTVYKQNLVF